MESTKSTEAVKPIPAVLQDNWFRCGRPGCNGIIIEVDVARRWNHGELVLDPAEGGPFINWSTGQEDWEHENYICDHCLLEALLPQAINGSSLEHIVV